MSSNPVALIIPSEGAPSKIMLNDLPIPNDRKRRNDNIEADFLNELLKLPKNKSSAVANKSIPNERTSFKALEFPAISIPSLALIFTGLNVVKVPITAKISPEINK